MSQNVDFLKLVNCTLLNSTVIYFNYICHYILAVLKSLLCETGVFFDLSIYWLFCYISLIKSLVHI